MVSQDFSVAGWGRENLGKKTLTHNCLWYVPTHPLPGFSGSLVCSVYLLMRWLFIWEPFTEDAFPWGPAGLAMATKSAPPLDMKLGPIKTFWRIWASFSTPSHNASWWPASAGAPAWSSWNFPHLWDCPYLQGTTGRKTYYPVCLCCRKFFLLLHIFFTIFIFFFLNNCRKNWIWIPAFAFKIKRGKKAAPKHGGFDLESCQNCLGFTDCPFVSGLISASSLSRKVFLWPSTTGSGVVWWQKLARHADPFKFNLSYFFLVCSGNLSLLFTWALSLLLEPFFFLKGNVLMLPIGNGNAFPWK